MKQKVQDDLQGKVLRGALVQLSTSLPAKLLGIGLTLLCTRIFSPQLYGEYGLAITIYGVSDLLTNPGVFTYFVRTPDASDEALDSAWTIGVVRGVLLTALFWFISPMIASYFGGNERVTLLLQILSSVFLVVSLKNPYVVRLYHRLEYQRIALLESLGLFFGSMCSLGLLLWTHSPAALAMGSLIGYSIDCGLTWYYTEQKPTFRFHWHEMKRIWAFVRFLVLNNVVIYLLLKLDDVFIGKMSGLDMLGLYALSYKVANDSVMYTIVTLRKVLLPAFVKLFEDTERLPAVVLKALGTLSGASWALVGAVCVSASEIMHYVAPDPKWQGADLVLWTLMPFVLIRAVNGVYGSLLLVAGRPDILSRIAGLQLVGLVPLMWLGFALGEQAWVLQGGLGGVLGVSLAIAALNLLSNLSLMWTARALFHVSMKRSLLLVWWWLPVTALAIWIGHALKDAVGGAPWVGLIVGSLSVLCVNALVWELMGGWLARYRVDRPSQLARKVLKRKRNAREEPAAPEE